jgi:threonine dehydrogenase-like Zn-dependent dehydrogenase
MAGICGTDLALVRGYYPFTGIPGHEFVGEIVKAPERPQRVGERVVAEINVVCRSCKSCLAGRPSHCVRRSVLGISKRNGAFAEYLCLPLVNLIRVSDEVPDDMAVFAEPLAAALEIQEQIKISATDRILVIGAGRLGQLVAQTLALTGCELEVVARYANQKQLLAGRNINWIDEQNVPEGFYDVVVEATGSPGGLAAARRGVRPRGVVVLKSTYENKPRVDISSLVVDEITVVGSRCGPFLAALRLIEAKRVNPAILIEERYLLKDALKAFGRAAEPGVLKVILQPEA